MDEKKLLNAVVAMYRKKGEERLRLKTQHGVLLEKSRRNVQHVFELLQS